jgi:long-chain acyl-CoA synthetase
LFAGKSSQYIETEVKYEDGRSGKIAAELKIHSAVVVSDPLKKAA